MFRVALIGDFDATITAHRAIPLALAAAAEDLAVRLDWEWLHTSSLEDDPRMQLAPFAGVWCVPGSPYANARGAIGAIRSARTTNRPFLGTCGGFQHAMLEYAQSHWQIDSPAHAETDGDASDPVITPLECALQDVADDILFVRGSRLAGIYGVEETREEYRCRFGLSPRFAQRLQSGPLQVSARDRRGGVIAVEHRDHPFFMAVLFQPERAALAGRTPPLVRAFVESLSAS